MTTDFEARLTRGLAQWITFVEANDGAATVRIGLTHFPDEAAITERVIEFTFVTRVVSNWFERDEECIESIIAAHEDTDENQLRYMFHTEQRELWIWALKPVSTS